MSCTYSLARGRLQEGTTWFIYSGLGFVIAAAAAVGARAVGLVFAASHTFAAGIGFTRIMG
jgi:hypothetical protein